MKGSERHIARLLDAWKEGDTVYLVLEYYSITLKKLLEKAKKAMLEDEDVVRMSYSLIAALNFLHSAGVMHRDIKPANLLVDKDFRIRICDFGLSRSTLTSEISKEVKIAPKAQQKENSKKNEIRKRSLSNHICSRYYRPPEVILLERKYAEPVDIWSSGCILLEIVSSTKSYIGDDPEKGDRVAFKGASCHPLTPPP
mmetsp:Transcript_13006/g.20173  ORF Transcript_13006/g.20173 Transcript_13006/m.20173 type:complete len:198 (+) Transcript_13006:296-889(+)